MHLGAGVLASAVVLFFSVTGALLAYERPILREADRRFYQSEPIPAQGARIPLGKLIADASLPAAVNSVSIHPEPDAPVEIETADRKLYLANPWSGTVQGPASPRLRAFFLEVTALHRWFGLSEAHHATAIAVKGAATLLLLFLVVSGAVLWLPQRWTRSTLRAATVPRFDTRGRALHYNWHRVTGFWIALPLTIVVVTGVIMAYPWANALLFRLAGSPLPVRSPARSRVRPQAGAGSAIPARLDEAFTVATDAVPGWQSASVRLTPGMAALNAPVNISIDRSLGGHPEKRDQVSVDPATLRITRLELFSASSRGQQWRGWVRFAHTGEAGGWWGETLALLTALGASLLSITGIVLFYHRLRR